MIKLVKILSYLIAVLLLTNPVAGAERTKKMPAFPEELLKI